MAQTQLRAHWAWLPAVVSQAAKVASVGVPLLTLLHVKNKMGDRTN